MARLTVRTDLSPAAAALAGILCVSSLSGPCAYAEATAYLINVTGVWSQNSLDRTVVVAVYGQPT
jgi:hypothetical protein